MAQQLTNEIISAALEGFEAQRRRLDDQISELRAMLSPAGDSVKPASGPRKSRRQISAAGRARIAEAQRKRWADSKTQAEPASAGQPAARPKRKLSAAGRKRISEATKKRWALRRAEAAQKAKPAAAKKTAGKRAAAKKGPSAAPAAKETA